MASYIDALSRSNSGVLIEKDNSFYYAIPSLDLQVVNEWMQLQKSVFPNLKICGIYSTEDVNMLDLDLLYDDMYYIIKDTVYKVKWLQPKMKELGYYTARLYQLELKTDKMEFKQETITQLLQKIQKDLLKLDLGTNKRFLLNTLRTMDLEGLKDIRDLLNQVSSQTRIEGAKSF